jgi:hypothetical protein
MAQQVADRLRAANGWALHPRDYEARELQKDIDDYVKQHPAPAPRSARK